MRIRSHACLALGLVFSVAACGSSTVGTSDGAMPSSDLPRANAAIRGLRLAGSNGATWYPDGSADDAPASLTSVPGHNAFWFAWSVFHPGTEVWEANTIADAVISEDPSGECTIPCDEIFSGCSGRDCIPPLDSRQMVAIGDPALSYLNDEDIVLGVLTGEGPRAYPHNILWWHEVANVEIAAGSQSSSNGRTRATCFAF